MHDPTVLSHATMGGWPSASRGGFQLPRQRIDPYFETLEVDEDSRGSLGAPIRLELIIDFEMKISFFHLTMFILGYEQQLFSSTIPLTKPISHRLSVRLIFTSR